MLPKSDFRCQAVASNIRFKSLPLVVLPQGVLCSRFGIGWTYSLQNFVRPVSDQVGSLHGDSNPRLRGIPTLSPQRESSLALHPPTDFTGMPMPLASIQDLPAIDTTGVVEVLAEIKQECVSFADFVEELLSQLDSLRADVELKSKAVEEEQSRLAACQRELDRQRQTLEDLKASDGTIDQEVVTELESQRSQLEEELELVRRNAAEMSDSMAQQQRDIAEERAEWSGELKEMRQMLEQQARLLADGRQLEESRVVKKVAIPEASEPVPQRANPSDPVVSSVMAQFAKLQKDAVARRREG